jgi:hypothetical protein
MAAAAISAIRKNGANAAVDTNIKGQISELTERLPPIESREVDIEIGMLLIGYLCRIPHLVFCACSI